MTTLPLAAGIGIEGIIWVIILIFWAIAQVVQKSRGSQRRPGMPPRPSSPMQDELRELLEQLSGQPSRPVVEPPEVRDLTDEELEEEVAVEPEPPPVQRRPPPPPTQPSPPAPRGRPAVPAHRRSPPPPRVIVEEELQPPFRPSPAVLADELPALKPVMVSQVMHMPGMAMHVPASQMRHGRPAFNPRELRNPQTLRQVLLARMILDPAKSLERPGQSLAGI